MKAYAQGNFGKHISVAGNPYYPAYVVKGACKYIIIDAGINLFGPQYLDSLRPITRGLEDGLIFLTHSHYDHLGSLPYLKKKMPHLKTGAHPRLESLLEKDKVLRHMNELSGIQKMIFRDIAYIPDMEIVPVKFDYRLAEGDSFDLGGITCEIYETPGHTRDSLSFFFPEIGALFAGEAIGVPEGKDGNGIQSEFVSSYTDYIKSLEKLRSLEPELIGMAHGWIFTDDDARNFIPASIKAAARYKDLISGYLERADGDRELTVSEITRVEYDEKGTIYQERTAFVANLTAQVNCVADLINGGNKSVNS